MGKLSECLLTLISVRLEFPKPVEEQVPAGCSAASSTPKCRFTERASSFPGRMTK